MYLQVPKHLCIAACWMLGTSLEASPQGLCKTIAKAQQFLADF